MREMELNQYRNDIDEVRGCLRRELSNVPLGPVFRPTEDEFKDPFAYIQSIREEGGRYGVCKIIPPPGWKPPNMVVGRRSTGMAGREELELPRIRRRRRRRPKCDETKDNNGASTVHDGRGVESEEAGIQHDHHEYCQTKENIGEAVECGEQTRDEKPRRTIQKTKADTRAVKSLASPAHAEDTLLPTLCDSDLSFPTRLQEVNRLKRRTGRAEAFFAALFRFLDSKNGGLANVPPTTQPDIWVRIRNFVPKMPMFGGLGLKREVDLFLLYRLVSYLGGSEKVSAERQWASVARTMHFHDPTAPGAIRGIYERMLRDFELSCAADSSNVVPSLNLEVQATSDPTPVRSSKIPRRTDLDVNSLQRRLRRRTEHDNDHEAFCSTCTSPLTDSKFLYCDACGHSYHVSCLEVSPMLVPQDSTSWYCSKCISKKGANFGFLEGEMFTLSRYEQYANSFKSEWFDSFYSEGEAPSPGDIEAEYWRIVESSDEMVNVQYGSDLDTKVVGSGFPNPKSWNKFDRRLPEGVDEGTYEEYLRCPWNLNIFPELEASLLDCLGSNIKGVTVPWLYFGMLFSSFCWHTEDSYMYSVNYMHFGQGKVWYAAPGGPGAAHFEAAFRSAVPELFEAHPDLFFHLVTMVGPHELRERGAEITRQIQMPGEFIITFPQAYHGGFSLGFNCAEAVNFATVDWLPFARASSARHRIFHRPPLFSPDELIFRAIRSPYFKLKSSKRDALLLLTDLQAAIAREKKNRHSVRQLLDSKPVFTQGESCGTCFVCRQPSYLSAVSFSLRHPRSCKSAVLCSQDFVTVMTSKSAVSALVEGMVDFNSIQLRYSLSEDDFSQAVRTVESVISSPC
mmetsp:Transcript_2975/g.5686  ORF Transcript_2975/g.5686 Transcript_2975/m.5686 type:complete len:850 (-) Transcript_2975:1097-3646(-)|eukprot:CAMPEP_0184689886 /NCGR_PEP_ID=MMETSP0312-20130426/30902_1 /TAXON_ID=31354 /ORGANISM="Compsopogon coeruleus, Strain SAG 36.94" /LENGTH=849 /DNA_ID=CAMNT_0027147291 /DNA_START=108 /DNA_END=2657 /DNA_ORIENTATION=+